MIPRRILIILITPLPFLVVAFAVFTGAYALSSASGDEFGATLLWWVAMFDLMFLIIDVLLLVICLSLYVLGDTSKNSIFDEPKE